MPMFNTYVSPMKDRNEAEFVEGHFTSEDARKTAEHLNKRLPAGEIAWTEWAERRTKAPDFDHSRLREGAASWPKGETGPGLHPI